MDPSDPLILHSAAAAEALRNGHGPVVLAFAGRPQTVAQAARRLNLAPSTVRRQAEKFVEVGLLRRRPGTGRQGALYGLIAPRVLIIVDQPGRPADEEPHSHHDPHWGWFLRSLERAEDRYDGPWAISIGTTDSGQVYARSGPLSQAVQTPRGQAPRPLPVVNSWMRLPLNSAAVDEALGNWRPCAPACRT